MPETTEASWRESRYHYYHEHLLPSANFFLGSADSRCLGFAIAGDDLDFGLAYLLIHLAEFGRVHHEGPHVVAESISVQVALEGEFGAHAIGQRVIDRFVELQQHFEGEGGTDLPALDQIVQALLQGMTQSRIAIQLITHCQGFFSFCR